MKQVILSTNLKTTNVEELIEESVNTHLIDAEIANTLMLDFKIRVRAEMTNKSKGDKDVYARMGRLFTYDDCAILTKNVGKGDGFAAKAVATGKLSARDFIKMCPHLHLTEAADGERTGIFVSTYAISGVDNTASNYKHDRMRNASTELDAATFRALYSTPSFTADITIIVSIDNFLSMEYIKANKEGIAKVINDECLRLSKLVGDVKTEINTKECNVILNGLAQTYLASARTGEFGKRTLAKIDKDNEGYPVKARIFKMYLTNTFTY